jgi:uncharacterized repeat protein (TIGR03803 family)
LTPTASGEWTETVLHSFDYNVGDGAYPDANLILDGAGNLYGTTAFGGGSGNSGTVFKLSPSGADWKETIWHIFGRGTDGATPGGGLIFDASGNLYGVTGGGGTYNDGTVFELTP